MEQRGRAWHSGDMRVLGPDPGDLKMSVYVSSYYEGGLQIIASSERDAGGQVELWSRRKITERLTR